MGKTVVLLLQELIVNKDAEPKWLSCDNGGENQKIRIVVMN